MKNIPFAARMRNWTLTLSTLLLVSAAGAQSEFEPQPVPPPPDLFEDGGLRIPEEMGRATPRIRKDDSSNSGRASSNKPRPISSRQIMPLLNAGWGESFRDIEDAISKDRDYITWIVKTPRHPMDLRNAEFFRRWINGAGKGTADISHMMVAWQCHDSKGRRIRGVTGLTGENSNQTVRMIKKGWGQTAFMAVFTDGELNTPGEFEIIAQDAEAEGLGLAHITFEVSRQDCSNMLSFLRKFIDHPNQPATRFGLVVDPLRYEGGGCGSMASALVQKAGVLKSLHPALWRTVRGSQRFMGGGLELPPHTEVRLPGEWATRHKYVWPPKFQGQAWVPENGLTIRMLDPELALLAFREIALVYQKESGDRSARLERTAFGPRTIKHVWWEAQMGGQNEYMSLKIPITSSLDNQTRQATSLARRELRALEAKGMKMRPVWLLNNWGLLISK